MATYSLSGESDPLFVDPYTVLQDSQEPDWEDMKEKAIALPQKAYKKSVFAGEEFIREPNKGISRDVLDGTWGIDQDARLYDLLVVEEGYRNKPYYDVKQTLIPNYKETEIPKGAGIGATPSGGPIHDLIGPAKVFPRFDADRAVAWKELQRIFGDRVDSWHPLISIYGASGVFHGSINSTKSPRTINLMKLGDFKAAGEEYLKGSVKGRNKEYMLAKEQGWESIVQRMDRLSKTFKDVGNIMQSGAEQIFPSKHPYAFEKRTNRPYNSLTAVVGIGDSHYVIPTMVNGKEYGDIDQPLNIAKGYGLDKYPKFGTKEDAIAYSKYLSGKVDSSGRLITSSERINFPWRESVLADREHPDHLRVATEDFMSEIIFNNVFPANRWMDKRQRANFIHSIKTAPEFKDSPPEFKAAIFSLALVPTLPAALNNWLNAKHKKTGKPLYQGEESRQAFKQYLLNNGVHQDEIFSIPWLGEYFEGKNKDKPHNMVEFAQKALSTTPLEGQIIEPRTIIFSSGPGSVKKVLDKGHMFESVNTFNDFASNFIKDNDHIYLESQGKFNFHDMFDESSQTKYKLIESLNSLSGKNILSYADLVKEPAYEYIQRLVTDGHRIQDGQGFLDDISHVQDKITLSNTEYAEAKFRPPVLRFFPGLEELDAVPVNWSQGTTGNINSLGYGLDEKEIIKFLIGDDLARMHLDWGGDPSTTIGKKLLRLKEGKNLIDFNNRLSESIGQNISNSLEKRDWSKYSMSKLLDFYDTLISNETLAKETELYQFKKGLDKVRKKLIDSTPADALRSLQALHPGFMHPAGLKLIKKKLYPEVLKLQDSIFRAMGSDMYEPMSEWVPLISDSKISENLNPWSEATVGELDSKWNNSSLHSIYTRPIKNRDSLAEHYQYRVTWDEWDDPDKRNFSSLLNTSTGFASHNILSFSRLLETEILNPDHGKGFLTSEDNWRQNRGPQLRVVGEAIQVGPREVVNPEDKKADKMKIGTQSVSNSGFLHYPDEHGGTIEGSNKHNPISFVHGSLYYSEEGAAGKDIDPDQFYKGAHVESGAKQWWRAGMRELPTANEGPALIYSIDEFQHEYTIETLQREHGLEYAGGGLQDHDIQSKRKAVRRWRQLDQDLIPSDHYGPLPEWAESRYPTEADSYPLSVSQAMEMRGDERLAWQHRMTEFKEASPLSRQNWAKQMFHASLIDAVEKNADYYVIPPIIAIKDAENVNAASKLDVYRHIQKYLSEFAQHFDGAVVDFAEYRTPIRRKTEGYTTLFFEERIAEGAFRDKVVYRLKLSESLKDAIKLQGLPFPGRMDKKLLSDAKELAKKGDEPWDTMRRYLKKGAFGSFAVGLASLGLFDVAEAAQMEPGEATIHAPLNPFIPAWAIGLGQVLKQSSSGALQHMQQKQGIPYTQRGASPGLFSPAGD